MKKRILPALLALAMVLTMLPMAAFAEVTPDENGAVAVGSADDLKSALTTEGVTTIKLTTDITVSETIKIEKAMTIDFDGKTVSGNIDGGKYIFEVGKADGSNYTSMTVVFQNAKIKNTASSNGRCLEVKPSVTMNITGEVEGSGNVIVNAGTLNITGGTYKCTDTNGARNVILTGSDVYKTQSANAVTTITGATLTNDNGIGASALWGATVNVEEGTTISAKGNALGGNNTTPPQNLNVHGGNLFSSGDAAIYQAATGTLTITGGEIKGVAGVVARAGTVNITGGTIEATGTDNIQVGNRTETVTPAAVVYDLKAAYNGSAETDSKIAISGTPTIKANVDEAVTVISASDDDTGAANKMAVSGGKFDKPVDVKYLNDSLKVEAKDTNGTYTYHADQAAAEAAVPGATLSTITNGEKEPIIKVKGAGFIWDIDDTAAKQAVTDLGGTVGGDWVDQTMWVVFDQPLGNDKFAWISVDVNGETWGCAVVGDDTHKTQAFSFLHLDQMEQKPENAPATGLPGTAATTATVSVYKTETQLSEAPADLSALTKIGEEQTVNVPKKPTNANPNLKIESVTTDAPLYAKVKVSGMDSGKVYAIRIAKTTGKDAQMVVLIVDSVTEHDIYCQAGQNIWVFEYASKDAIQPGNSQHTSLVSGTASKISA